MVIDVVAWFRGVRPRPPRGGARESMLFSRGIVGEVGVGPMTETSLHFDDLRTTRASGNQPRRDLRSSGS